MKGTVNRSFVVKVLRLSRCSNGITPGMSNRGWLRNLPQIKSASLITSIILVKSSQVATKDRRNFQLC